MLAVATSATTPFVAPNTATIRNGSYPLSRQLFIFAANGSRKPNTTELQLLDLATDRSFMDPIMQNNEFITLD
jgi:ABC-type phosphate transport system substrate-binding protein